MLLTLKVADGVPTVVEVTVGVAVYPLPLLVTVTLAIGLPIAMVKPAILLLPQPAILAVVPFVG